MKPLIFRSAAARVGAWAWLVFAALNFVDIALRGHNLAAVVAAAVLLAGCGVAYVFGLRPRIAADEHGIEFRNPLRDVKALWPAVRKIEAGNAILLHYTDAAQTEQTARAWVLQSSPRARARAERRSRREQQRVAPDLAAQLAKRTPTEFAVEQLNELATPRRKAGSDTPAADTPVAGTSAWSARALAALAIPATFLLVMIVVALVG